MPDQVEHFVNCILQAHTTNEHVAIVEGRAAAMTDLWGTIQSTLTTAIQFIRTNPQAQQVASAVLTALINRLIPGSTPTPVTGG